MRPYLLLHRKDFNEEGNVIGHDVIAIRRNALVRRVAVLVIRRVISSTIDQQSRDALGVV